MEPTALVALRVCVRAGGDAVLAWGLGADKGRIRLDLGKKGQLLHLGSQEVVVEEAARIAAMAD